jgi:PPK2 family polyphosphate:nucleotide phosphotransferase
MLPSDIVKRFRVRKGGKFNIKDHDAADTYGLDIDKEEAKAMLAAGVRRLSELQERLYAQDRWAVLVIIQAMDAAGKDGVIKHVMSGINPQGCQVHAFKAPSPQELDHDFMWRTSIALPERGRIGLFNRSYYEETLVVRVHPEILARQKLPAELMTKKIWTERFEDIRAFERYLTRNGTLVLKFFLNVSKEEQRKRFLERIEEPAKRWKFAARDVEERKLWGRYIDAYQDMIRHTATREAPWYVVPADNKWFTRLAVAAVIGDRMEKLALQFPKVDAAALREMRTLRTALQQEASGS